MPAPAEKRFPINLTTVRHDLYRLGTLAVDGALSIFRKDQSTYQQTLDVQLVERESTGPAPAA